MSSTQYQKDKAKRHRQQRKDKGLCQQCGKERAIENRVTCQKCMDMGRKNRGKTNGRMSHLRHEAKRRGLEITIIQEELDLIKIPEYCPLLGIPLRYDDHNHYLPSYDRKDNSKGYIPGNIWVISALANLMKRDASIEELQTFARNILLHFPD